MLMKNLMAQPKRHSVQRCSREDPGIQRYLGVGNFYLINSEKLQIGIGIGKFSVINSEELHIGKL